MTRLEEAQGLTQAPETQEEKEYPEPAPLSTKGEEVDHKEPADPIKDAAIPPKEISDSNPPAISEGVHPEKEVGHVMVEGSPEKASEIRQLEAEIIKSPETQIIADLQPAALDPEVAAIIAEEEMKDTIPPSPEPIRSLSPLPVSASTETERIQTPPLDDVLDLGEDEGSKKRPRDVDMAPAPKRPRRRNFPPLPESLSHLIHPPTTCIYISNLRRPLLLPALHEYLFPDLDGPESASSSKPSTLLPSPRNPFSSEEHPNVWLSGVKSHAYAIFESVDQALLTVKRIEGKQFPEETGAELKIEFVDEDEITRLVEREEQAWANGRQKLDLKVAKEEDGGYRFTLEGAGNIDSRSSAMRHTGPSQRGGRVNGPGMGMASRQMPMTGRPLTGVNAVPAGVNGRGGGAGSFGRDAGSSQYANNNGSYSGGGGGRYPPRGGFGGGSNQAHMGSRGAPPRSDSGYRDRSGPSGDAYVPRAGARDRDRDAGSRNGGGVDSYRPRSRSRDRNGGVDSYRPGGEGNERRTSATPNLNWKEGSRR